MMWSGVSSMGYEIQLSLKIPIFILLTFSPSVYDRKILLNFPMNLIPDRRRSVAYSEFFFF